MVELYDKFDFTRRYMNTEDYAAFVPKLAAEREGGAGEARAGQEGLTTQTRRRCPVGGSPAVWPRAPA